MGKKSKQTMPSLPAAELDVLSCVLQRGKVTAREIREALSQGKAFVYAATQKPGTLYRFLVGGMLLGQTNNDQLLLGYTHLPKQ